MPGQAPALPVRVALCVLSPALCQAAGKAEPGPGEAKGGHSSLGRAPRKPLKANWGPHRPGRDLSPRDTGKGVGKPGLGQLGTHLAAWCPCQDGRARGQALDPYCEGVVLAPRATASPGECQKCHILGLPDLLDQNLHFNPNPQEIQTHQSLRNTPP